MSLPSRWQKQLICFNKGHNLVYDININFIDPDNWLLISSGTLALYLYIQFLNKSFRSYMKRRFENPQTEIIYGYFAVRYKVLI